MLLVIYVLTMGMKMGICIAHVFCQDEHATDWTPLGYSCPINCAAVIAAVKRLQEMDYDEIMSPQQSPFSSKFVNFTAINFEEDSVERLHEKEPHLKEDEYWIRKHAMRRKEEKKAQKVLPLHYIELYQSLLDKRSGSEILKAFKYAAKLFQSESCRLLMKGSQKYMINKKCVRRSAIQDEFLKQFSDTLNKHTKSQLFNKHLTGVILEKLLGNNADLQLGVLDVKKILKRLKHTIEIHKQLARAAGFSITLKSKYCLNIYMPGCFCIPGYVEDKGQCVRPIDCFPDLNAIQEGYLARIHVQ